MKKRIVAGLIAMAFGMLTLNAGCGCGKGHEHDSSCYTDQVRSVASAVTH